MEPSLSLSYMYSFLSLRSSTNGGFRSPPIGICGSIFPLIPLPLNRTPYLLLWVHVLSLPAANTKWICAPTTGIDGFQFFLCDLARFVLQFSRYSMCAQGIYVASRLWTSRIRVLCRHSWMKAPASWCLAPISGQLHPAIVVDFTDFGLIYRFRAIRLDDFRILHPGIVRSQWNPNGR